MPEHKCRFYCTLGIVQSNLVIRNGLIRNKLVLRNHLSWPNANLLYKDKEHLALRNNFRVTKKFLITTFDCTSRRIKSLCRSQSYSHARYMTKLLIFLQEKLFDFLFCICWVDYCTNCWAFLSNRYQLQVYGRWP